MVIAGVGMGCEALVARWWGVTIISNGPEWQVLIHGEGRGCDLH